MKVCCTRMKQAKRMTALLPVIITFLATQHWLHALLFIMAGGTANELMNMSTADMLPFQRVMIGLTFVTVLWSIYQQYKEGFKRKGMIVLTSISSMVGIGYIIVSLVQNGW
ncbi:MAG: hypothetical protein ACM32O_19450 [Clostridia bacterium]